MAQVPHHHNDNAAGCGILDNGAQKGTIMGYKREASRILTVHRGNETQ